MENSEPGRPAALGVLLKLAWRHGTYREHVFIAMIYLVVPAVILLLWGLAVDRATRPMLDYIGGSVIVWGFQIGFFQQAFLRPVYTPAAYREIAKRQYGPGSPARYSELARYLDARQRDGHLPGEIALGAVYWAAFYSLLIGAVAVGYTLGGLVGFWSVAVYAALVTPLCVALWMAYRRRVARFYNEMESLRYRVREPPSGSSTGSMPKDFGG